MSKKTNPTSTVVCEPPPPMLEMLNHPTITRMLTEIIYQCVPGFIRKLSLTWSVSGKSTSLFNLMNKKQGSVDWSDRSIISERSDKSHCSLRECYSKVIPLITLITASSAKLPLFRMNIRFIYQRLARINKQSTWKSLTFHLRCH